MQWVAGVWVAGRKRRLLLTCSELHLGSWLASDEVLQVLDGEDEGPHGGARPHTRLPAAHGAVPPRVVEQQHLPNELPRVPRIAMMDLDLLRPHSATSTPGHSLAGKMDLEAVQTSDGRFGADWTAVQSWAKAQAWVELHAKVSQIIAPARGFVCAPASCAAQLVQE